MPYYDHALAHYEPKITQLGISQKELNKCPYCQLQKFASHQEYPIRIKDTKNQNVLPQKFTFIEKSILSRGIHRAAPEFRAGCDCDDDRACQRKGCSCLMDMVYSELGPDNKIYAYHSQGSRKELLRGAVLHSRDPIYECHSGCTCSKDCSNRVVERGRKVPLDIFQTEDGRGLGVRCPFNIKRGQFIDKYIGEIITSKEADRRRKASKIAKHKDIYLFALDKFTDPKSNDPRLRGPPLEVDGEYYSGPTRFINHSCDPNLRIFARVGDYADKHLHDLAFFAIKDIPAETELTFDYVDGEDDDLEKEMEDPKTKDMMTKCLCNSENCRGYLW